MLLLLLLWWPVDLSRNHGSRQASLVETALSLKLVSEQLFAARKLCPAVLQIRLASAPGVTDAQCWGF